MSIQLVKNRIMQFLFRRVRVKDDVNDAIPEQTLGASDFLARRLFEDIDRQRIEGRDDVELDALDAFCDTGEGAPNRLICVPLGDGSHHMTVLHGTASQRKHCW